MDPDQPQQKEAADETDQAVDEDAYSSAHDIRRHLGGHGNGVEQDKETEHERNTVWPRPSIRINEALRFPWRWELIFRLTEPKGRSGINPKQPGEFGV